MRVVICEHSYLPLAVTLAVTQKQMITSVADMTIKPIVLMADPLGQKKNGHQRWSLRFTFLSHTPTTKTKFLDPLLCSV